MVGSISWKFVPEFAYQHRGLFKQSPWFVPYASTDSSLSVDEGYRKFCCPSCHIIIIGYIVFHSDRKMEILVSKFHTIEVILFDLFLIICSYVFCFCCSLSNELARLSRIYSCLLGFSVFALAYKENELCFA